MKRKDSKCRNLKENESQMKDGRYRFRYTDRNGNRKSVYSWKLVATDKTPEGKKDGFCLREMEKAIQRDMDDGISASENITLNDVFDKYMESKGNLKSSTRDGQTYLYNHFIRNSIGNRKIRTIKFSDVKALYNRLLDNGTSIGTISLLHSLLRSAFKLAVRDNIIRVNPTLDAFSEVKKTAKKPEKRHALTVDEQRLIIDFLKDSVYNRWYPLFIFLLGTGCRIGEAISLRWDDVDFKNKTISINHNAVYTKGNNSTRVFTITTPKTTSGTRIIPMFPEVREALLLEKEAQMQLGIRCNVEIDGYSNFVFLSKTGSIHFTATVFSAFEKIRKGANQKEAENAKRENREPIHIRHFSAHSLRHTFCTRLCECEQNLKLIQLIMGHTDIKTTMDIYNEIQQDKRDESYQELTDKIRLFK